MPIIDGAALRQAMLEGCRSLEANKDRLCAIDGETGDGDHGISMTIGARAMIRALNRLAEDPLPCEVFQAASDAFADEVGATIGPLYESAFASAALATAQEKLLDKCSVWANLLYAMADAISRTGGAQRGDKTLLDALLPAADHMSMAGNDTLKDGEVIPSLLEAARIATDQASETRHMIAGKGRASRLGSRSAGHPDAGATSFAILLAAMANKLAKQAPY